MGSEMCIRDRFNIGQGIGAGNVGDVISVRVISLAVVLIVFQLVPLILTAANTAALGFSGPGQSDNQFGQIIGLAFGIVPILFFIAAMALMVSITGVIGAVRGGGLRRGVQGARSFAGF